MATAIYMRTLLLVLVASNAAAAPVDKHDNHLGMGNTTELFFWSSSPPPPPPPPFEMPQTLPAVCSQPVGDCSFYTTCMEAVRPCGPSGYSIGYGGRFCGMFTEQIESYSARGQVWVRNVRLCLQEALVPYVALALNGSSLSCGEIETFAFQSHVACYTDPLANGDSSFSVCTLPITDWLTLLWTIRSSIVQAFRRTIDQALGAFAVCTSQWLPRVENEAELEALVQLASTKPETLQTGEDVLRALEDIRALGKLQHS